MAPLGPQDKILVSREFLSTEHGEVTCESCMNKAAAHTGFDPRSSVNNPRKAFGDSHEEILATAKDSLHATLSTFPKVLVSRADKAIGDR